MATKKTDKAASKPVAAFKGFNPGYECRGFKYEIGQTYKQDGEITACGNGFHACEYPLDVFRYYEPAKSVFAQVEQSGTVVKSDDKQASSAITIKAALSLQGLVEAAIEYTFSRTKKTGRQSNSGDYGAASNSGEHGVAASNSGYSGAASNSGYYGAASNSGVRGAASNSGVRGAASNSGDYGAASNSGNYGAASNSGYSGAASNSGEHGVAAVFGADSKAKSSASGAIVLIERHPISGAILHIRAVKIGDEGTKPDVWYALRNGQIVEAE